MRCSKGFGVDTQALRSMSSRGPVRTLSRRCCSRSNARRVVTTCGSFLRVGSIIVGVPGPWGDQDEVLAAIGSADGPATFVAEGDRIIDVRSGRSLAFEVYPHDPRMEEAFAAASGGKLSKQELWSVAKHRTTVYLIGPDCSLAGARHVMATAAHLLDVGGVGVKVESAGVAHAPDCFRYHARSGATLSAYRMFVTLVGGEATEHHYSCGMHNLGLPDVSVVGSVPVDEAAGILTTFNQWNLLERPRLKAGAWFSCAEGEPAFTASHHPFGYEEDDPLNNPLGRWHLSPTDRPGPGRYATSMSEPMFMALSRNSPEVVEATRRARATVGYLREQFASPYEYGRYLVKVRFPDGGRVGVALGAARGDRRADLPRNSVRGAARARPALRQRDDRASAQRFGGLGDHQERYAGRRLLDAHPA